MEEGQKKKLGVVLSGGGARGIAHLGVLKAFDELGIPVHMFSGTSSGAIAGALYATGYAPDVVLEILVKTNITKLLRPAFAKGLMHMGPVERLLQEYLGDISFEDLKIPLVVASTDLNQGICVYFSSGKLIPILIASASVPVLFRPVRMGDRLLVDGGVLNNLPVEGVLGQCDYVLGVHSNPVHHGADVQTFRKTIERTFHLLINNSVQPKFKHLDLLIEPQPLKHYSMLSFSKATEFFEIGYTYTMEMADKLLTLKEGFAPPIFNRAKSLE